MLIGSADEFVSGLRCGMSEHDIASTRADLLILVSLSNDSKDTHLSLRHMKTLDRVWVGHDGLEAA